MGSPRTHLHVPVVDLGPGQTPYTHILSSRISFVVFPIPCIVGRTTPNPHYSSSSLFRFLSFSSVSVCSVTIENI